ncbi:UNVERIFIED_CONTAM: hypothetical protein GTU68_060388 [Idotea baltica]|nr:hypothetical protein [Idotea baltica]
MTSSDKTSIKAKWDWLGLICLFLFFWYFSGVTHLLLLLTGKVGFVGFRDAFIMSSLWLIPVLLFPKSVKLISAVIGVVLWLSSLVGLGYFFIYGQEFSQSVIFVMFESNVAESTEYFLQYFVWWMIPVYIVYTLIAFLLWRRIKPLNFGRKQSISLAAVLFLSVIAYPLVKQIMKRPTLDIAFEKFEEKAETAVPWQLLVGYHRYITQLAGMQKLLDGNAHIAPLENLVNMHANEPTTLVLVIGESTNRQRMNLYGYPRTTTPGLNQLKDQLAVFNNVISPRPYTIEVLQQALTFGDEKNPDGYLTTPTILNMMKQAGYKTYWITNQQTMTKRNTMLTTFSKEADEQVYLNNNLSQNTRRYDGDVLQPFKKILHDKAQHKLIVVHLLGTHMKYKYRYPDDYAKFKGRQDVPTWVSDSQLAAYNSYDNAVLYNDFVVSSLIHAFSASKDNGFLLYLSDHGEAVYDAPGNVLGRNEEKPLLTMYTIPFIVWASDGWKNNFSMKDSDVMNRHYSSADLIYTWADLAGIQFDGLDYTRSLISDKFKKHPLLIGDPYKPKSLIEVDLDKPNKGQLK